MRRIPLRGARGAGLSAKVSDDDYERLSAFKWYLSNGYAKTTYHKKGTGRRDKDRNVNVSMHRLVMRAEKGQCVDHINGDRLDNRRENLRLAYHLVNAWNTDRSGSSGFLGVTLDPRDGRFRVSAGGKYFGSYGDAETAARVYDKVITIERAEAVGDGRLSLNFPGEPLIEGTEIVNLTTPPRRASRQSKTVGVTWFKPRKKWRVIVKRKTLGYFDTEEAAVAFRRSLDAH